MDAMVHQSSDALERELKFSLQPGHAAKLRDHPLLANIQPAIRSTVSTYFDTPDHAFGKAKVSLRLRAFDDHTVQTLKLPAARSNGLFMRGEYETEISGNAPDIEHLRQHFPPALRERLKTPLSPVFRVEVRRTEWIVQWKESAVSLAVDEGCIKTETRTEPLEEMEIELQSGRIEDVFDLARQFASSLPLRLEVVSKAERGYLLMEEKTPLAEKAGAIKLGRKMTAFAGFQTIASLCIHHFAANERLFLATGGPEALHQMRVAIRRLRSLIGFFGDILPEGEIGALRTEMGRLFKSLGTARDLDVLLVALRQDPETQASAALEQIGRERDAAYRHLSVLLTSQPFCLTMLDLLAFVECGTWMKAAQRARGAERLNERAALILKQQRKKMRKFNSASHLEATKRHRLRIQAKKFRYACEFFGDLFKATKAQHRHRAMSKMAEDLQDALGQLNDRVFRQEKLAQWIGGEREPNPAQQREDEALEQNLLKTADLTQKRLLQHKSFWT